MDASIRSRRYAWMVGAVLLLLGQRSEARPSIAVLAFGGAEGEPVRTHIVGALQGRYLVIHGDRVLDACDALGIQMTRGRNLARCAAKAGVIAVVGGAVQGGRLSLMVFSAKDGQVVGKGKVACSRELSPAGLRDALSIILSGLRKAPQEAAAPSPEPAPRPKAKPPKPLPRLEFDPNAKEDDKGSQFTFEPEPVEGKGGTAGPAPSDEDPLEPGAAGKGGAAPDAPPVAAPVAQVARKTDEDDYPRVLGLVGLGTWIRDFSINDPAQTKDPTTGKTYAQPGYNSGAAFALRVAAKARPAAFLTDGFASWLYLRAQFQTTLGLQSKTKERDATGQPVDKSYGTSFLEFLLDAGVDWNLLGNATSPHLELGLGYGMMDFGITWETDPPHSLPDVSYSFFLIKAGVVWPFWKHAGAHLGFDYRVVGGSGEVEDETNWYGPSSTGGINLALGLDGRYKGILASVEYTYTRYFYAFDDADLRVTEGKRAAGGALDILHGILVCVGYGF